MFDFKRKSRARRFLAKPTENCRNEALFAFSAQQRWNVSRRTTRMVFQTNQAELIYLIRKESHVENALLWLHKTFDKL